LRFAVQGESGGHGVLPLAGEYATTTWLWMKMRGKAGSGAASISNLLSTTSNATGVAETLRNPPNLAARIPGKS
jgi:hypothetical protein